MSARLGEQVDVPELTPMGLKLVGGRVMGDMQHPLAGLVYEDREGHRLTIGLSPRDDGQVDGLHMAQVGGVRVGYWSNGEQSYVIVADTSETQLAAIVSQLNHTSDQAAARSATGITDRAWRFRTDGAMPMNAEKRRAAAVAGLAGLGLAAGVSAYFAAFHLTAPRTVPITLTGCRGFGEARVEIPLEALEEGASAVPISFGPFHLPGAGGAIRLHFHPAALSSGDGWRR